MESFLLAIKRNNNDYVPIDWTLSSLFKSQAFMTKQIYINSLESIDMFTKKYSYDELINGFLIDGLIDETLKDKPLVIIFKKNDKYRELRQGIIYDEDSYVTDYDFITSCFVNNIKDKELLNSIYTFFKGKNKNTKYSDRLEAFLSSLGNINSITTITIMNHLANFNELTYFERRSLGIRLKDMLHYKPKENIDESISLKKESIYDPTN